MVSPRNAALAGVGLAAGLAQFAAPARAQPWLASSPQLNSVEVVVDDEQVFQAPGSEPARRGAVRLGARLPVFAEVDAPGCRNPWLLVGAFSWLCGERVRPSEWPADPANQRLEFADGLPFRYHFVGAEGSFGYPSLTVADLGVPQRQFEPGFSVAVVRMEPKGEGGELYAQTSHGLWLPARDLHPANPSDFQGVELAGERTVSWVVGEDVSLLESPGARPGRRLPASSRVFPDAEVRWRGRTFLRLDSGEFLASSSVRTARVRPPPADLLPDERWLDIDLSSQTLVAYEGSRAIFATLVSTGRSPQGTEQATPKGDFRVWVKLLSTDMTNLEDLEASNTYAIEDVPWVMFFEKGYGLHGAFWHRSFGNVRSHGCVNLSPLDAQRLFHWVTPRLPTGFRAVRPTAHDRGTRVIVH